MGGQFLDAKTRTGGATVDNNEPARDAQAVPRQGRVDGRTRRRGGGPARTPARVPAGPGHSDPAVPTAARVRE